MGNCTMRLPIVGMKDGKILGKRTFDNLCKEVGFELLVEEQEILTEAYLRTIEWIPDYKARIYNVRDRIIEHIKNLIR